MSTSLRPYLLLQGLLLLLATPTLAQRTFVQSVFNNNCTPQANGDCLPNSSYNTLAKKKVRVQHFAELFDGGEIANLRISGAFGDVGRQQTREISEAMRLESQTLGGRKFLGYYNFPRLPGFFWPEELAAQPASWRSHALKTDGTIWVRAPRAASSGSSQIDITGEHLDITNEAAVQQLLANIAEVFNQDGGSESIGPLFGYIFFNEPKLTGTYGDHLEDVVPPASTTLLRAGNGTRQSLMRNNDDPFYSFTVPPKRAIPLYSASAQQSFAQYAAQNGHPSMTLLPADRDEFNHLGVVELPAHVQFVDMTDTAYWETWRDWVYETWSIFLERVSREMSIAQHGNPDYRGAILFLPSYWYSFRQSELDPIDYQTIGEDGRTIVTRTTTLANYAEFEAMNSVSAANDMDYLMSSRWFAGMVNETSRHIHRGNSLIDIANMTYEEVDDWLFDFHRYEFYHLAHGAVARKVCRDNGKLFGGFLKTEFHKLSPVKRTVTHEYFHLGFQRSIATLQPALVGTIGPYKFFNEGLDGPWLQILNPNALNGGSYRSQFPLGFSEHPWPHTVDAGQHTSLHAAAAGGAGTGTYDYQWQYRPSAAQGWQNLTASAHYSNVQTPSMQILAADASQAGDYRLRLSDSTGTTVYSPPAHISVAGSGPICAGISQEAETGALTGFIPVPDLAASGGAYVVSNAPNQLGEPNDAFKVSFCMQVLEADLYRIKARVRAPSSSDDSFWVRLNGTPVNGWNWSTASSGNLFIDDYVNHQNGSDLEVALTPGNHLVEIFLRENGTQLDSIELERSCGGLFQEAEAGTLNGFVPAPDPAASGGTYIVSNAPNQFSTPNDAFKASFCMQVLEADTYRIKARLRAPSSSDDSFWVRLNSMPMNGWNWPTASAGNLFVDDYVNHQNGPDLEVALTPGNHLVEVFLRENGTQLDSIELERSCGGLFQEAEAGTLTGFVPVSDTAASGGTYVVSNASNQIGSPNDAFKVSFCMQVLETDTYRIKARLRAPSSSDDSFWVRLNGTPVNGWNWSTSRAGNAFTYDYVNHQNGADIEVELTSGTHLVEVFLRENGAQLDNSELVPASGSLLHQIE